MQRNSLSLCMIVRDAEETVGRAIKSALAIVDEVVVVDTGSADNTRLIVEGYGARVIDHPWSDDFSAARNAGIEAAYGDWILILDADEVLETIRPVEVGRLLNDTGAIGYFARIREGKGGEDSTVYDRVRLFRNHPDARYRYPIHEQITPSLTRIGKADGQELMPSRLSIVHQGSTPSMDAGKRVRNQRLLQRAVEEFPDEPWFQYQLARNQVTWLEEQMLPVKGFAATVELLGKAVARMRELGATEVSMLSYSADLFARYAGAQLAAGKHSESVVTCEEGLRLCGDASILRFTHARALIDHAASLEDEAESTTLLTIARAQLQTLLHEEHDLERAPISSRYFGVYPMVQLGRIALAEGKLEEAGERFREAMRRHPDYTLALCGLAGIARAEGRVREALQIYLKALAVEEREVAAWIGGAEALIGLGFDDNARSWLDRLAVSMPEHPALPRLRGLLAGAERPANAGA